MTLVERLRKSADPDGDCYGSCRALLSEAATRIDALEMKLLFWQKADEVSQTSLASVTAQRDRLAQSFQFILDLPGIDNSPFKNVARRALKDAGLATEGGET